MKFNQIKMALYATYLTNYFGFKLKKVSSGVDKKSLRKEYSSTLLDALNIEVNILNPHKIPDDGQFLLVSNHRSVIDPLIVELALKDSKIFGHWISKKELYNSFFFGTFVRNAGTILVDREETQMSSFFKDIKTQVKNGDSIYIFPEGTRNKTTKPLGEFQGGAQLIAIKNRLKVLPLYIRTQANDTLMASLKSGKESFVIDVEVGDILDPKDRTLTLEEAYKKSFNLG